MLSLVERITLHPQSMAIRWNLQGFSKLPRKFHPRPVMACDSYGV